MKRALLRLSSSGAIVAACFSAAAARADTPITIVNELEQPLVFKAITNREHVQIKSDPPATIPAHSSGKFRISAGAGNKHLNVTYAIQDTEDEVAVVYKHELSTFGNPHCPKEHPKWVTEHVKDCGEFDSKGWAYTFSENSDDS